MGVNELSTSANEDQPSDSSSSIKERDANIPRDSTDRRTSERKEFREGNETTECQTSEIPEVGGVGGNPQTVPVEEDESLNEGNKQLTDISPSEVQSTPQKPSTEGTLEVEENSNYENKNEESNNEGTPNQQKLQTDEAELTAVAEGSNSTSNEQFTAELCAPQSNAVDADSSSDEEEGEPAAQSESVEASEICEPKHNLKIDPLRLEEQNSDSTNSLFEDLLMYRKQSSEEEEFVEPLEISTNILSYERFFPGRILGNTFTVRNVGSQTVKFQLSFDNSDIDRLFVGEKLCDYYGCDNINEIEDSYTKHLKREIDVSQEVLNAWNIEDPYTKRLAKTVHMELESGEEYEFIVVLKSPIVNQQTLLAANVKVYDLTRNSLQTVFCFGWMETLKINCPKEMYNKKLKSKMIKIVMRRKQAAMPIKVLLENKGDMPICSNFQSVEMEKNLQFYIPRDKLNIEPNSKALLEIKALHKLGAQNSKNSSTDNKPEVIHKLVVAKIKDCEFKFSLIFEITII